MKFFILLCVLGLYGCSTRGPIGETTPDHTNPNVQSGITFTTDF